MSAYSFCSGYTIVLLLSLSAPLLAGEEAVRSRKHSLTFGGGMAVPADTLKDYMLKSGMARIGYGYRFFRYFQADVGLDAVFRAARVNISQQTIVGKIDVHDYEYLVPFGGRAILPMGGRVELFCGGGASYMRYQEEAGLPSGITVYSPEGVHVDCPSCKSRSGWGSYGTAGGNVALDRGRHVWLGLEMRLIRGKTSGQPLGSASGYEHKDGWINTTINISYRF